MEDFVLVLAFKQYIYCYHLAFNEILDLVYNYPPDPYYRGSVVVVVPCIHFVEESQAGQGIDLQLDSGIDYSSEDFHMGHPFVCFGTGHWLVEAGTDPSSVAFDTDLLLRSASCFQNLVVLVVGP